MDELAEPADHAAAIRHARQELNHLDDVELALRHAQHLGDLGPAKVPRLTRILTEIEARRQRLVEGAYGHLEARQRPKQRWDRWNAVRPRALVAIDETGLTSGNDPAFPIFATAAVVIRAEDVPSVNQAIHAWQQEFFGTARYIHEMDIRKYTGPCHFSGDREKQAAMMNSLTRLLSDLPYSLIAVVIDKEEFHSQHPDGHVDAFLPSRLYPLAIHMLFERVVHCLYSLGDLKGDIEAEGVGEIEDAYLQQSVATLKLRGTRYMSERWFRYQLRDHVEFFGKTHNRAGLELADWLVRPCAEAVLRSRTPANQSAHHAWWDVAKAHLYDGCQSRPDTFGLKVYPSTSSARRQLLFTEATLERAANWQPIKAQGFPV